MQTELSNISPEDSGIAFIAKESNQSTDDVSRLFVNEMAKLEPIARIKGFLPIFALRNVRKLLAATKTKNLSLAMPSH